MPRAKAEATYRELAIDKIDPPDLPMRETMDEIALEDLAQSIALLGVLQPIVVEERNGRYHIEDGHRRYIAATRAGRTTIPAIVRDLGATSGEAVKVHANIHREDVHPVEEASYFTRLLESECGGDVNRLAGMIKRRREYIEDRLLLLQGDPDVLQTLRERKISLAVARELNRIRDQGYRRMYLDAAARGGANARLVMQWRQDVERVMPVEPPPLTDGANQYSGLPAPIMRLECFVCHETDAPLELLYAHPRCRKILIHGYNRPDHERDI